MGSFFSNDRKDGLLDLSDPFDDIVQAVYSNDLESLKDALALYHDEDLCKRLSQPIAADGHRRSVLHKAAWSDESEILRLILTHHPKLEQQDVWGWTPLWAALYRGRITNTQSLIGEGALVPSDPSELTYLLDNSVKHGYFDVASWLYDQGATLPTHADENLTFLHVTIGNRDTEMTRLLLDKGKVDANIPDACGWYPLHLAVAYNDAISCKMLLEHEANVNVEDQHGNTPLAWARQLHVQDVCSILEENGGQADSEWKGDEDIAQFLESNLNENQENEAVVDRIEDNSETGEETEDHIDYEVDGEDDDDYGPNDLFEDLLDQNEMDQYQSSTSELQNYQEGEDNVKNKSQVEELEMATI